ncbi:MAG: glycosyltransferase family 2 protein [Candidatus Omnitrophica bacterium]|nr:glycosyltransferase family 2 protein [Candidatus Omnitrophota bacterium]
MLISIVIPARNEENNIGQTVEDLEKGLKNLHHETLIINDHSIDATAAKVSELSALHPSVKLIDNTAEPGFASTLWTGFRAASGEAVVVVMADSSDDPQTIPGMTDKFTEGYDLVCGSRYLPGGGKKGGPKAQGFFSFWVNKYLRIFLDFPTSDASNAFKLYRRECLLATATEEEGFALSAELAIKLWQQGCKIIDVPTVWKGRAAGKSKFKFHWAFRSYGRLLKSASAWKFKSCSR